MTTSETPDSSFPGEVRRRLRSWQRSLRSISPIRPGGQGLLSNYLDRRAARRVLGAIIEKTRDVSTVSWLGRQIWQYPLDAWIIQEVISTSKPDLIIETGSWLGGSAYFFASLCDLMQHGEVISIDIAARGTISHPRITYLSGSSTDPRIVSLIAGRIRNAKVKTLLVVLDSDHSAAHVRQELEAYAPLIPVASYIHIQDGCIDELPRLRIAAPGPAVGARSFLQAHPQFVRDTEVEHRYVMTAHPYGWLKRIAPD